MIEARDETYRLRSLILAKNVPVEDGALVTEGYFLRNRGDNLPVGLVDRLLHIGRDSFEALGNPFRHCWRVGSLIRHGVILTKKLPASGRLFSSLASAMRVAAAAGS